MTPADLLRLWRDRGAPGMNDETEDSTYIELEDGITWQVLRLKDEDGDSIILSTGGDGAHMISLTDARRVGEALVARSKLEVVYSEAANGPWCARCKCRYDANGQCRCGKSGK